MRLLVLGGTGFLGRFVVDVALSRGHEPTIFHRGRTGADLFPEVPRIVGDRLDSLGAVAARSWDAVIDLSGFEPRAVHASVHALSRSAERYVFISSVSAYAEFRVRAPIDEGAPLASGGAGYGASKAASERVVSEFLADRSLIIRPGVLTGPGDPTGRITYWPKRLVDGGDVLVPGPLQRPVQFLDGRDLADWLIRMVERRAIGTFNAVGPRETLSAEAFLAACGVVIGHDPRLVWVDEAFLLAAGVRPWIDLPLWSAGSWAGFQRVDGRKAFAAGLRPRPIGITLRDTLDTCDVARRGLLPDREAALLDGWRVHVRS